MTDWLQPEFDKYREWIQRERDKDRQWPDIEKGGKPDKGLDPWLEFLVEFGDLPPLGTTAQARAAAWAAIVAGKRKWEEEAARNGRVPVVVGVDAADRDVDVPSDPRSSYQMYRHKLLADGWRSESVDSIESSSLRILRRLRWVTKQPSGAVKGMVVGHVQSGKTASMAGLISMSMDWGWNLIVVLTGTIENLRLQTHNRLLGDLKHGNLALHAINHPSGQSPAGERAQDCQFNGTSKQRNLVVSLKNPSRLGDLKRWIEKDQGSLEQMRILIIDDEADQASLDTSPADREERTKINKLIVELSQTNAKCVNYVAYTATPYANFLNEAWPDSLYPKNFIIALPQSTEHFGPKQIFGIAETESEGGLGLVREVPIGDLPAITSLHAGESSDLPPSLQEALAWFLCSTAAIRAFGDIKKPISMLVHTSVRQSHHQNVVDAISNWLRDKTVKHLEVCRDVWRDRCSDLSLKTFKARMPEYGRADELREYPAFSSIESHIRDLLKRVTHIEMEMTDKDPSPKYHSGIHVCIDNCANNGISDEGEHHRLLYPTKKELSSIGVAPAFLVVGGSTLSRGLTIENLVSTYFLRGGAQMDTLMQMGRWFGFRRSYELLPRIWMPADTRDKFVFIAGVEQELREELALFMDGGRDPSEYGPRVRVHPSASWLRPTAANKMKESQGAEFDYSGVNKQITIFHASDDASVLTKNLQKTETFLSRLGTASSSGGGTAVWIGIHFSEVSTFLLGQAVHGRARFFREISPFVVWFEKNAAMFDKWNVVVGGRRVHDSSPPDKVWALPDGSRVGKVNRSRLIDASDADSVGIGVLRDPNDLLADAVLAAPLGTATPSVVEITRARNGAGLQNTPQLLLYRIDRNSEVLASESTERGKLDVPEDLIGVSIWMPGGKRVSTHNFATHVSVRIPDELRSEGDDVDEIIGDVG